MTADKIRRLLHDEKLLTPVTKVTESVDMSVGSVEDEGEILSDEEEDMEVGGASQSDRKQSIK